MSIRCPACNAYVDEKSRVSGGGLRCEKCGMRFQSPRVDVAVVAARDADPELGIHPALAKKYRGTPAHGVPQQPVGVPSVSNPPVVEERAREATPPPVRDLPSGMDVDTGEQKAPTIELSPSLVEQGAQKVKEREERTRALGPQKKAERRSPDDERDKSDPLPAIPGYVVLGVVGKGAMGRVYRARAEKSGALAAVKTLAPELAARPDFIARFEREAAALKAVDHPGVVSIIERGAHGDVHYLCMPFVDGESLRRGLAGGPLAPLRALGFARQIAQALGAAHDKKVIHRDLKPENILVTRRPSSTGEDHEALVLVDFGLAGMGEDDPHPNLTKSRMTMGTVNYMAPEQRTDAKRVGPQADVYAAGVILYELLTGDLPLGRFKMPTERPGLAHLPPAIDDVLARALDRDPERRYPSAHDFDRDLARVEAELVAQVSRDTVVGRAASAAKLPESGPPTEVASRDPMIDSSVKKHGDVDTLSERKSSDVSRPSSRPPSDSSLVERRPARKTFGPQWITSPPWVKHPHLVWGALALLVGAGIGLLATPSDDVTDVASGFPVTPGWRTTDGVLTSVDDGGPPDAARPILTPLVGDRGSVSASVARLSGGDAFAGVIARQANRVVGVGTRSDGTCVRVEQGRVEPIGACRASLPTDVALRCAVEGELVRCVADMGNARDVPLVDGRAGTVSIGLVCSGQECAFDDVALDAGKAVARGEE